MVWAVVHHADLQVGIGLGGQHLGGEKKEGGQGQAADTAEQLHKESSFLKVIIIFIILERRAGSKNKVEKSARPLRQKERICVSGRAMVQ